MAGNSTELDKLILFLTPGFPENEMDYNCIPSIQGYIKELAKEIGNENIIILSFQYPFKEGWYYWNNIKVYSAGGKNKGGINRLFTFYKIFKEANKLIKQQKPIAIHSLWFTATAFIGNLLSKKHTIKHIISLLGQDALHSNLYLKIIDKKKNYIVANSQFVAKIFEESTKHKVNQIIHLGINKECYKLVNTTNKEFDIIGCGSLSTLKQFDQFIEIINLVKLKLPQIKAIIIGDGPEFNSLQQHVNFLNLNDNISLIGKIDHPKIFEYLSKAKVFLHTSKYEASSHAILEANFCKLPVVSFKVGYIPFDGCNFSFDEGNKNANWLAMANKIISLLQSNYICNITSVPEINETVVQYKKLYQG